MSGGEDVIALKKLYGAAFTRWCAFKEVTNAIGRGTTALTRRAYASFDARAAGSMIMDVVLKE